MGSSWNRHFLSFLTVHGTYIFSHFSQSTKQIFSFISHSPRDRHFLSFLAVHATDIFSHFPHSTEKTFSLISHSPWNRHFLFGSIVFFLFYHCNKGKKQPCNNL